MFSYKGLGKDWRLPTGGSAPSVRSIAQRDPVVTCQAAKSPGKLSGYERYKRIGGIPLTNGLLYKDATDGLNYIRAHTGIPRTAEYRPQRYTDHGRTDINKERILKVLHQHKHSLATKGYRSQQDTAHSGTPATEGQP